MKLCKAIGVSLVLTGLLSACSSVPLVENTTGINLLETNKPVYTLVNLHPDMNNLRLYTVNYQQDGLIPRCTPVKIQQFNKKILSFKDLSDERTYTLIKHGSSPDFVAYLNKYFGTACDTNKVNSLSDIDKKGITEGSALIGMSKDAVVLAIGYPPEHKTTSLKNNSWIYWSNRFNRFAIGFNEDGYVESIQD